MSIFHPWTAKQHVLLSRQNSRNGSITSSAILAVDCNQPPKKSPGRSFEAEVFFCSPPTSVSVFNKTITCDGIFSKSKILSEKEVCYFFSTLWNYSTLKLSKLHFFWEENWLSLWPSSPQRKNHNLVGQRQIAVNERFTMWRFVRQILTQSECRWMDLSRK